MDKKILPIVPLIGLGISIICTILVNTIGIKANDTTLDVISIISIIGGILGLSGLPIGIIYKKKEGVNETLCIIDIIIGCLTLFFAIMGVLVLIIMLNLIAEGSPLFQGFWEFLNRLTEIG